MKLVTFTHGGKTRVGAIVAEEVVDISGQGRDVPSDMLTFLEQGETAMHQAREVCASGRGRIALADVTLDLPATEVQCRGVARRRRSPTVRSIRRAAR